MKQMKLVKLVKLVIMVIMVKQKKQVMLMMMMLITLDLKKRQEASGLIQGQKGVSTALVVVTDMTLMFLSNGCQYHKRKLL